MSSVTPKSRILKSGFKPARWLLNRHAQTVYPSFPWASQSGPQLRRESLDLPDGDVTAIDWMVSDTALPKSAPILVILHGLEGSAQSPYARMLMQAAFARGWQSCVLNFRDCGDYRNRLPRRYHAGETNDIRFFLDGLQAAGFDGPLMAVGYSLGGNVLLKYLGETGAQTPLVSAAAVSSWYRSTWTRRNCRSRSVTRVTPLKRRSGWLTWAECSGIPGTPNRVQKRTTSIEGS